MESHERELVAAVRAGKTHAFEKLLERYEGLVCHIVYRLIPDADRKDVCQDIFMRVFQGLDRFRFECKLSTWIGRIAYHTCLHRLQKKRPSLYEDLPEEPGTGMGAEEADLILQIERRELLERVDKEIAALPLLYRTLLTLYHVDDMRIAEISRIVDLPEGTVKNYLHRARARVRQKLNRPSVQEAL
ncbi:sigma-70 family RNA polymerase sigma factor [candidate division KSB1 bacterium]|nr:sigma-70 family RNA polymerase sigma factor [candidate division KSB1 bacterium]